MTNRTSQFANYFQTTLSASMGPTDLAANVVSTAGAPASPCYLTIEPDVPDRREVVFFDGTITGTAFNTTALTNRYLGGSAATSGITHPSGSKILQTPLAQHFQDLHDRVTVTASQSGATAPLTLTAPAATDIPLSLVGAGSQTANLQEWRNSAGTVLTRVLADGTVVAGSSALRVGANATANSQTAFIQPADAGHSGLVVRGTASQTASFFAVQENDGRNVLVVDGFGSTIIKANATGSSQASLYVDAPTAGRQPLIIRAAASQTAKLTEWLNSAGTEVLGVQNDGRLRYSATHAVTTARTAGSASALPGNPVQWIEIIVGSSSRWIPVWS